jgi:hypothetical protein
MVSETQDKSRASVASHANGGSLQKMNLGSLLVGQLGQAINWSNDASFKKPECKPWVDLPISDVELTSKPSPVEPTPSQQAEPARETPVAVTTSQPTVVDVPEEITVEEVSDSQPTVVSSIDSTVDTTVDSKIEPESAKSSSSDQVEAPTTTIEAKRETDVDNVQASSAIAIQPQNEIEIDAKSKSSLDESVTQSRKAEEIAAAPSAATVAEPDPAVPAPPAPTPQKPPAKAASSEVASARELPSALPAAIDERSTNETEVVAPAAPVAIRTNAASKPVSSMGSNVVSSGPSQKTKSFDKPVLPTTLRPIASGEQSQEEYLLQLERLVVELNMELASVRGEQEAIDPIEQMANRIIALNLENLALREKLQRTNQ